MATKNQEIVAKRVAERVRNGEKISISKEMRESGVYSKSVAVKPGKLTRSKGWAELMQKYLPESHLGSKHREFLDSHRIVKTFRKGDLTTEVSETDPSAVKALDMAYKLQKKYPSEKGANPNTIIVVQVSREGATKYGIKSAPIENPQ